MDLQSLARKAVGLHQQGRLAEAEQIYLQIIRQDPAIVGPHYMLGTIRLQQGRFQEAAEMIGIAARVNGSDIGTLMNYGIALQGAGRAGDALESFRRVTQLRPDLADAHYNSGVALADLARFEDAIVSYEKALVLRPDHAMARGNLGVALAAVGRFDDALAAYDRVLAIQPLDANAWFNRGLALAALDRQGEAVTAFERASAAAPGFTDAITHRGVALLRMQRFAEALAAFDMVLPLRPADAEIHSNRAVALWKLGRMEEAAAGATLATEMEPGLAGAWANRGLVLRDLMRFEDALASFEALLSLEPGNASGWNSCGTVLRVLKRPEDAVESFSRAVTLKPDHVEALVNRGHVLWTDLGCHGEAIADLEQALALEPDHPYLRGELLHLKMYAADWRDFEDQKALLDTGVRAGRRVVRPFAYQALSDDPADLQACSVIFAADQFAAQPMPASAVHTHDKIRVGYVSADFRDQATAHLMAGLYEHHDKARFEIVAFDNGGSDASPVRARLEAAFDRMIDIRTLTDDEAGAAIRAEEIDILVNLNGYFGKQRMGVFARRPASVQVNYLGFPATLGAPYMDYILADAIVIPAEEHRFYTEKVVTLPGSYQVNDDRRAIGPATSRAMHGLPDKGFVFCNFNQSYKLTPETFAAWVGILKQVEGSVLWLLETHPLFRTNLSHEAQRLGLAPDRLVFAPNVAPDDHLARLKLADLFLDTLPYNAHTTGSDALWAGVPLLTLRGTAFPGRVAASLLTAAGVPELIAETRADYERLAVKLATDPKTLKKLRNRIAKSRTARTLFDTARTTRHIEAAYIRMWENRARPPESFSVSE